MTTKREYIISIKTQLHTGWSHPQGWGPYATLAEAREARDRADRLWMQARIVAYEIGSDVGGEVVS